VIVTLWVDASAGELFDPEDIIHPVVSVNITGSMPLLVNYYTQRISSTQ
jgi:hypothetical protein